MAWIVVKSAISSLLLGKFLDSEFRIAILGESNITRESKKYSKLTGKIKSQPIKTSVIVKRKFDWKHWWKFRFIKWVDLFQDEDVMFYFSKITEVKHYVIYSKENILCYLDVNYKIGKDYTMNITKHKIMDIR
jgi:hypothetical protein